MGSRSKISLAYIAGFLDGDGSLMLQLKKRGDSKSAYRIMATICFYQDSRHEQSLYWIRDILGIGYISQRNDGITELRVNGFQQVKRILRKLLPHIRFKKVQAEAMYYAAELLNRKKWNQLTHEDRKILVDQIVSIQANNYATRNKKTPNELYEILGLTP